MSIIGPGTKLSERRAGLQILIAVLMVALAVAAAIMVTARRGKTSMEESPNDKPAGFWQSKNIDDYRYTMSLGCF